MSGKKPPAHRSRFGEAKELRLFGATNTAGPKEVIARTVGTAVSRRCLDETSLPSLIAARYRKIFQIHAPIRTAMASKLSMSGMTCGLGIAGP
jgi:hypothetical protein